MFEISIKAIIPIYLKNGPFDVTPIDDIAL